MSKCTSGYIFPKSARNLEGGDFSSHIDLNVLATMKDLCNRCTNRDGPFGTHTCRKNAYLLAIWGQGDMDDIKTSARHADQESADVYKRDATTLLEYAKKKFHFPIGGYANIEASASPNVPDGSAYNVKEQESL
jgi:hypothetical protein